MAKKAILVPRAQEKSWQSECFPRYGISDLPVAGKAFIEYQLDALSQLGVTSVLVLDYDYEVTLAEHLAGGGRQRWPFALAYQGAGLFRDEDDVRRRHAAFIGEDAEETLVVIGMRFPIEGEWVEIDSLKSYYDLNFKVLSNADRYTLPGYSSEKGIHLGMNVMIKTGHPIEPPLFLGDNVRIEFGVHLMGNVIVGRGSSVDSGAILRRAIVFPNTYVGRMIELDGKIVAGSRVLDPESGIFVDLDDVGLSSEQYLTKKSDWLRIVEAFLALLLIVLLTPIYLVWWPFSRLFGSGLWSYRFSMDRYPRLWRVLLGRARLIKFGNTCREWVFRASDGMTFGTVTEETAEIEDAWFVHNRTLRIVFGIVAKGLIRRFLANGTDFNRDR